MSDIGFGVSATKSPPGTSRDAGELQQLDEHRDREVLDDVDRDDRAERPGRQGPEVLDAVAEVHGPTVALGLGDHPGSGSTPSARIPRSVSAATSSPRPHPKSSTG